MKLIYFPEQTVVFAKDQPEYFPLPAYMHNDVDGRITCCWELSWGEVIKLIFTRKIWHTVLTFYGRLQPQLLEVDKPVMRKLTVMEQPPGRRMD